MSRGSKYGNEIKLRAVLEYSLCGSLAEVGESCGIPRKTLSDWYRSEWWNPLSAELRQEQGEPELAGEHGEVAETKLGRPTAYKPEYAKQALSLCLLGATDAEMADFFDVSEQTINAWKGKQPSFLESLRRGKIEADSKVAESLYARATGYECDEEKMTQEGGKLVKTTTTKRFPPDFQSMALWLKNRRPNEWTDTRHVKVETESQKLVVILTPEMHEKMHRAAGESLDYQVIDGECEQIEESQ